MTNSKITRENLSHVSNALRRGMPSFGASQRVLFAPQVNSIDSNRASSGISLETVSIEFSLPNTSRGIKVGAWIGIFMTKFD